MPVKEEKIVDNPMKLYTYLNCISGLASYPENTRMFRQKDLMLTKIKEAIGITDKTVKRYMYQLEQSQLVSYNGEYQFTYINEGDYEDRKEYLKAVDKECFSVWTSRYRYEKNGVYYIPCPKPFTPVPETTLETLNKTFKVSELELKLYLLCCAYRDTCVFQHRQFKVLTFEQIRDTLGYTISAHTDAEIRKALIFLRGVGLIEYREGIIPNRKGGAIPSFKISEVYYYISYKIDDFSLEELETNNEAKEMYDRIKGQYNIQEET
jgi:transcription initiation factor IIE alpha subunit